MILVIVNNFTKMVYYKPMKTTIDIAGPGNIIINRVVRHHDFFKSIIDDQGLLFIPMF